MTNSVNPLLRSLCVFCASTDGVRPEYRAAAEELGVNVKLIGIALSGPYRTADGSEHIKQALEYALLRDIEDSMEWDSHRVFPIGRDEILERNGPLWDTAYRIEASSYLAHNEAAAMNYAAQTLFYLFFTRAGYELRKNLGNEQMQLTVADLAAKRRMFGTLRMEV